MRNILRKLWRIKVWSDSIFLAYHEELLLETVVFFLQSSKLLFKFLDFAVSSFSFASLNFLQPGLEGCVLDFEFFDFVLIVDGEFVVFVLEVIDPNFQIVVLIAKLEVLGVVGIEKGVVVERGGGNLWTCTLRPRLLQHLQYCISGYIPLSYYYSMPLFQPFLLLFLACTVLSTTSSFEALNLTCVNASYITSSSPVTLTIPTFSRVDIQVDLRHLKSAQDLIGVVLELIIVRNSQTYKESLALNVSTSAFSLYAGSNIVFSAVFSISGSTPEEVVTRSYLFKGTVSALVVPPDPLEEEQKTFLFVISSQDFVSLPFNVIGAQNASNFPGFFLSQELQLGAMRSRQSTVASYSDYWNAFGQLATPYLPYFSNCQDSGDYLYFSQMIHNASECTLFGYGSTPINEFSFGSSAKADTCLVSRNCLYDESPSGSHEYPVWSTLDPTSKYLFYVTASEYSYPYEPVPGREFSSSELVRCQILTSQGDNSTGKFPLKVKVTMGYYQESARSRRMLRCEVEFSLYAAASSDFQYQLEVVFAPLNHTSILLDFGFRWYIYMLVFILIGAISNTQFVIFWLYHILTTVKAKATFRLCLYLRLVKQILKGILFAVAIAIPLVFAVQIVMNGTFFGVAISDSFGSFWDLLVHRNTGVLAASNLVAIRKGRMGFSYIVISLYLSYHLSPLLVGKERRQEEYQEYEILGQKFKPLEWNRGKVIFGMYLIALCSTGFLYFTFSSLFNANIWTIICMMQIAQMVLEEVLNSLYDDVLPCIPMKLSVGVLAYLATMGAIDLYYFMLGYLVDVGISTIERAYLSLIQEKISKFVEQKNQELHRFYVNLLNDEEEEQERKTHDNDSLQPDDENILLEAPLQEVELFRQDLREEYTDVGAKEVEASGVEEHLKALFLKAMAEQAGGLGRGRAKRKRGSQYLPVEGEKEVDREKENKKFELLNDSAGGMVQYWLQPIVVLMLWITYNSSGILTNFQIAAQNCILYMLSSVILAISYQLNVLVIFHVLELYFNFDYRSMVEELLGRFQRKQAFWVTEGADWEEHTDRLDTKMRACNRYCLSSQMYFVVSLYALLIYLFIIGFTTLVAAGSNILHDPYLLLIVLFWLILLALLEKALKKIVYFFDIWDYASFATGGNRITEAAQDEQDSSTKQRLAQGTAATSEIRFTFKQLAEEAEEEKGDRRQVLEAKLTTICKRLEPTFDQEDFRKEFAIKNKDYIRKNIDKILPLVTTFPASDTLWLGRGQTHPQPQLKKREAKNIDPGVSDFVGSWLKRVEANRLRRQDDGVERERSLKRCNFCFSTWGVYFGFEGICLECSRKVFGSSGSYRQKQE